MNYLLTELGFKFKSNPNTWLPELLLIPDATNRNTIPLKAAAPGGISNVLAKNTDRYNFAVRLFFISVGIMLLAVSTYLYRSSYY